MRAPLFSCALAALLISSCDIINPDEQIPAFIHIEKIDLETEEDGSEGTNSENFTDAWVYSGPEFIGTFELPATFPILIDGSTRVDVYPGIKENGISATRAQYGFMQADFIQVDLVPGETVELTPTVGYLEDVLSFDIIDFETIATPPISEVSIDGLDLEVIENPTPALEYLGTGVGRIQLNDTLPSYRLLTTLDLNLAVEDFVYVELDYSSTVQFVVGLRVSSPFSQEIIVAGINSTITENGTFEWRKIYMDFGTALDRIPQGTSYELVIVGESNNGSGTTLIDNLKVIFPN